MGIPIGTRIRFLKTLEDGSDEYSPGSLYAVGGDLGEVTGPPKGCRETPREGHWVKWDKWPNSFGAKLGEDFEVYQKPPADDKEELSDDE